MAFTSTDALKRYLLQAPNLLTLRDIEKLCTPLFNEVGLDAFTQRRLDEYVLLPDGHCLDAEAVFNSLGFVTNYRIAHLNAKISEQNGKKRYMITKRRLCQVLQCDDRFSEYFALKFEIAAIYSQYRSEGRSNVDTVLEAVRSLENKIDTQMNDLQSAHHKLDSVNVKMEANCAHLKSERLTNERILSRVSSMATELFKIQSYAIQEGRKSENNMCHGFAITTAQGRESSTDAEMYHYGIIIGSHHHVDRSIESEMLDGRQVFMPFTFVPNPLCYFNDVVVKVQERLEESAERANAVIVSIKCEENKAIQDQINALKQERMSAMRQYSYHMWAWNNPESVRQELNAQITTRNQVRKDRLQQTVASHNESEKRYWQCEWPKLREPKLVSSEQVHAALKLTREPSVIDYISSQRLTDLMQEMAHLKSRLDQPADTITDLDIPVKVSTLALVWTENKWFRRDELESIFYEVLTETQNADIDDDDLMALFAADECQVSPATEG